MEVALLSFSPLLPFALASAGGERATGAQALFPCITKVDIFSNLVTLKEQRHKCNPNGNQPLFNLGGGRFGDMTAALLQ